MNYPAASCGVSIKDSNPSLERSKLRGTNPKRELDRINRIDMIENQNSYLTPARRSSLEPQRRQRKVVRSRNAWGSRSVEPSELVSPLADHQARLCFAWLPRSEVLERPHSESGGRSSLERIYKINEMSGLCVSRNGNPDYRACPVGCFFSPIQAEYPDLCCSL
jgi:hypothetical protein